MNQNALFNVIAQPILWILEELKNGVQSISRLETLQTEAHAQLSHFVKTATTAGYSERSLKIIHYALCVALDQAGKQTTGKAGALKGIWMQQSLLAYFYKEQLEHNRLNSMVQALMESPSQFNEEITVLQHLGQLGLALPATVFKINPTTTDLKSNIITIAPSTLQQSPPIQIVNMPPTTYKPWIVGIVVATSLCVVALLITLILIDRQERQTLASKIVELNNQLEQTKISFNRFQVFLKQDINSGLLEASLHNEELFLTLSNELAFKSDSTELSDAAKNTLHRLSELILNSNYKIKVIGHSDSNKTSGIANYNQALSEHRAKNVANYLITLGVSQDRMQVIGMGSTQPIADNTTIDGRQLNRRVDIVLY